MRCPSAIEDEDGRLRTLADYGLSPDKPLPSLDPIVEIAARLFDVPAAAVNMIGRDEVFFAASTGIGACDMRRDVSFCAHAITQDDVMVVEDALADPRFHDNPLVAGALIRFYAGIPLRAPSGHALGALCIVDSQPRSHFTAEDRTRLKELARMAADKLELRRLEVAADALPSRLAASASNSPDAVFCFDGACRITVWNDMAATLFGHAAADACAGGIDMLVAAMDRERLNSAARKMLEGGHSGPETLTGARKDGSLFLAEFTWLRWKEGGAVNFGAVVRDATYQLNHSETLYRLANYDSLTGLPNRNLLHARAAAALRTEAPGLIMIDLDGFKDVNDTLGHAVGDAILHEVAARLASAIGPEDVAARIGGDEFAILLVGPDMAARASELADTVIAAIACPIRIDGHEVRVAGSCGLAIAPDHGGTVDELLSSADLALFQAKTDGRGRSFLYVPALRSEAFARRMYDAELHRAVERGEFVLHYQPQCRLADGALTGAEALIRWRHPVRGLLQPAAFLPALEGGSLAATVGAWILETASAQVAQWLPAQPDFRMSVNLFAAQFRTDLPAQIDRLLVRHDLPPGALEVEITENIVLDREDLVLPQLRALRARGVALAFDDFGTGYASLNLLKSYPISHIKIDKSFIQAMQESEHDRAIVLSLITLSHQLDLSVIAEGVETEAQHLLLREQDCEEGQGYLFGRPVPAELFAEKFGLVRASLTA
ncbi:putative bifunctional diguanylate cyclase/phosphodiesterase [Sphingomonas quercus]|uniref:EAL domain-containing protein n=1 Tax=Sphingomonas quercus TaxID=2842451 RepID=A0ABS6BHR0_9SPHN|nr:EAL domain-containing protein [Sphingomonas quercus]MBU3077352.1 EAL domain-containing protein [Sphingomonas quercus]